MSGQFGTFDGLDNRRELFRILERIGEGESEERAAVLRARALQRLTGLSPSQLAPLVQCRPMSPADAYCSLVGLTGVFGVPIEQAAMQLEGEARRD